MTTIEYRLSMGEQAGNGGFRSAKIGDSAFTVRFLVRATYDCDFLQEIYTELCEQIPRLLIRYIY